MSFSFVHSTWRRFLCRIPRMARVLAVLLLSASIFSGYSVLTHEAIIDSLWETSIQKLLVRRFPMATPDELAQAHAYVYGGCILQDMGYYPFSSKFFSDLTHYVRSGDFVVALIRESQDLNEYAFALGSLAHYAADDSGHRIATNLAVPILYPELRSKFGRIVTYWDNPNSHLRTEFGFDVLQVAQGRYAPDQYRKFIGFEVAKPLLERAFQDTYGLEMKDVFASEDLALGSFRYGVRSVIPGMTRAAWQLKKQTFIKEIPGVTKRKFLYNLSRSSYEKEWGTEYHKPGWRMKFVTFLFRLIPKFGPFKALKIATPTPEVEKLFMASFNATVDSYKAMLANVDAGGPALPNENIDVGELTRIGRYKGADEAYAELVGKLADRQFVGMKPDLRENILAFYKDLSPSLPAKSTKKQKAALTKLLVQLDQLKSIPEAVPAPQVP